MRLFQNWSSPKVYQRRILFEQLEERIVLDAAVTPQPTNTILDNPEPPNTQQLEQHESQVNLAAGVTVAPLPPPPTPAGEVFHQDLNVVLISNALDKIPEISQGAMDAAKVITYDALHDNLITIVGELQEVSKTAGQKIDNLAIIGHGAENAMRVGTDRIDFSNVGHFSSELSSLGQALSDQAQIQLFTCSLAKDASGKAFVDSIAKLTGADVYASDDNTGGDKGDWTLEYGSDSTVALKSLMDTQYLTNIHTDLPYAPELTISGTAHGAEDTPVDLSHLVSIKDQDVNETVTVTLTANQGFSTLDAVAQTGATVTGHNTSIITIEGSQSAVNETLNHLTGALVNDWNSSDGSQATVLVHVSDSRGNDDGSSSGTLYASIDTGTLEAGQGVHVLAVSSAIQSSDQLVHAAADGALTVTYDPTTDSPDNILLKIEAALSGYKADSIAFATHDQGPGQFYLTGDYSVNSSTLLGSPELQHFWKEVGSLVNDNGRIDLLACGLGSNETGKLLLSQLESMVGRNFAASDDATGNTQYGGDWVLESDGIDVGPVYFSADRLPLYQGVMEGEQKLIAPDGESSDWFGLHVAISGNYAIVGAHGDDIGTNSNQGSAYIYELSGGTWVYKTKLMANDGAASDYFGNAVAINGNYAIVGANGDTIGTNWGQGSAYIYELSGGNWVYKTKLTATDGAASDYFGNAVAINGNYAIVGAVLDDVNKTDQGSAYIYELSGGSWVSKTRLTASDGAANDHFGSSVSISGNYAIVGAALDDVGNTDQGSAYIYELSGGSWVSKTRLTASDGAANDHFGSSVSVSGNYAIVGAGWDDVGTNASQGSAYIYELSGGNWVYKTKLTATDGAASDCFGNAVAINGNYAIIGAEGDTIDTNVSQGSSYIYEIWGGSWVYKTKLTATDGIMVDWFGGAVSISDNYAIVGAYGDDIESNGEQGSAYLYNLLNKSPTDITLSNNSVNENLASGTTVGTFTTTDTDSGDTFTYSLVSGAGSTDNGSFTIEGNTLKTNASFDYESKDAYSVRVRTTDLHGASYEQQLAINVRDVNAVLSLNHGAGTLDPTFDSDGMVTTYIGESGAYPRSVAIQADGKIILAGWANGDFGLARYNSDGSLDTTFSGDGKVTTDFGSSTDQAYSVAIQTDGKIVVAGDAYNGSNYDFALARYNSDGSLDTTFSGDGKVTTDFGSSTDKAYSVAIQTDGKIVVAGQADNSTNSKVALARYNSDGSLDTTFSGDGKLTTDIGGGSSWAKSVAIQADGKIVVSGSANYGDFAAARYNSDGSLDTSFDADGMVTIDNTDGAKSMAIQADGKIVVAGWTYGSDMDFGLARFNSNGSLDTSFSGDGKLTTDIGGSNDYVNSVAIQPDGKIVVAGYSQKSSSSDELALVRYNSNGSLDTSFSGDGKLTTDIGGSNTSSVAIQPDGKIVVAAQAGPGFGLVRYDASHLAYTENAGAQVIDSDITLTDTDSSNMSSAKIQITGNYQSAQDMLSIATEYSLPIGVTATWDGLTGRLTLTGSSTIANYDTMLEHVTYTNSSDDPNTDPRAVSWTVNDGTANSATQTSTITVTAVNDAPAATGPETTTTLNEDGSASITVYGTDVDNPALSDVSFTITSDVHNGTLVAGDMVLDSAGHYSKVYTYTPDANFNGSDPFEFTFTTKSETSSSTDTTSAVSVPITVTAVNDVPVVIGQDVTAYQDHTVTIRVKGIDIDNPDVSDVSFQITATVTNGSLNPAGLVVLESPGHYYQDFNYTPNTYYSASDNFQFVFQTPGDLWEGLAPYQEIAGTGYTESVSLGDVNSDGKLDVVAGNWEQTTKVYLGDGTGGFNSGSNVGSDTPFTQFITLGDINGDNKLDVVVGTYDGQTTRVYMGDGLGGFDSGRDLSSDTDNTRSIALGDVNEDGKLDVVTGNYDSIKVYLGDGTGGFDSGHSIVANRDDTRSIALGDVNNDGNLDVLAANYGSVKVFLGNGTGGFGSGINIDTTANNNQCLTAGDVDNDGNLDVVVGTYLQNSKVYLGNGLGGFDSGNDVDSDADFTRSILAVDVDNDGNLDVITGNWNATNKVYLGNGSGGFDSGQNVSGNISGTQSIALGDIDNNGYTDVVVGSWGWGSRVYPNNGSIQNSGSVESSAAATVSIDVEKVNELPAASGPSTTTTVNEDGSINITAFGTDVDNPALVDVSFAITSDVSNGILVEGDTSLVSDGHYSKVYTYTPDANFIGSDPFEFTFTTKSETSTDNNTTSVVSVPITVTAVNDLPEATGPVATTSLNEDGSISITVFGTDVDNPALSDVSFAITSNVHNGNLAAGTTSLDSPGHYSKVYTYTPNANFIGSDPFEFTFATKSETSSGTDTTSAVSVPITVNAVNDAPVLGLNHGAGTLDPTFGGDGIVTTSTTGYMSDYAYSMAIQADGKIVVVGEADNGESGFGLIRYNCDGSLDLATTTDISALSTSGAYSVAIQSDGKMVVAGYTNMIGHYDFAIVRYNVNGSLDSGFGNGGVVTTDFGGTNDSAQCVVIQADGKIVVAGTANIGAYVIELARYNTDGSLDSSFDSDGILTTDVNGISDSAQCLAIQADGKIVVAGSSELARYNSDGSLDTRFDGSGLGYVRSETIQNDGKIVVAGIAGNNFGLARFNSDGSLDSSFDTDGIVTTDFPFYAYAYSVSVQNDGKIVVAGTAGGNFGLARFNSDGSPDSSFDSDGKLTTDVGGLGFSTAHSVALQSDGKIAVAGTASCVKGSGTDLFFAVARYLGPDILAYTENAGAQVIDNTTSLTDSDSTNMSSAKIQITGNYQSSEDTLSIDAQYLPGGVTGNWDVSTGKLTLNGVSTIGNYESMLEHVTYTNRSDDPHTDARTVTWTVNDGTVDSTAQASNVTVTAVNDLPTASGPDVSTTLNEDGTTSITVYGTDVDNPDLSDVSFTITSDVSNGIMVEGDTSLVSPGHYSKVYTYTPDANFNGSDPFEFTFTTKSESSSSTDTTSAVLVPITVNAVNDAPAATGPVATTSLNEDGSISITVFGTDVDNPALSDVSFTITSDVSNGIMVEGDTSLVSAGHYSKVYTYTPDANFNGSDPFEFTFTTKSETSSANNTTSVVSVPITVTAVNDLPGATGPVATTSLNEDGSISITVFGTDVDNPALSDVSFTITSDVHNGTLVAGDMAKDSDGHYSKVFTYTPDGNFNGSDPFEFTFTTKSETSSANNTTSVVSVPITVTAVNDLPGATGPVATTSLNEDGSISITVFGTDVDNPALSDVSFTITSDVHNGTLVAGDMAKDSDGHYSKVFTYTPDGNFNGSDPFEFTFTTKSETSTDNDTTSAVLVPIIVTAVNDMPTTSLTATTSENSSVVLTGWTFDDSKDSVPGGSSANNPQHVKISSLPVNGSLFDNGVALQVGDTIVWADVIGGNVIFQPNANWVGATSFLFTVVDDGGTANGGENTSVATNATINVSNTQDDNWSLNVSGGIAYWTNSSLNLSQFKYDYSTGQWYDEGPTGGWSTLGPAGLSSSFLGDGSSHILDSNWSYNYSGGVGFWTNTSLNLSQFKYDYSTGQWYDEGPTGGWATLGPAGLSASFLGVDGRTNTLDSNWQYQYSYDYQGGSGAWISPSVWFIYNYKLGHWWGYDIHGSTEFDSSSGFSASFIGDGAWHNIGTMGGTHYEYQYDMSSDHYGYWFNTDLGFLQYKYDYDAGQWYDEGKVGGWATLGSGSLSSRFMGDGNTRVLDSNWSYNYSDGLGYWTNSSLNLSQFKYDYITGQWYDEGPTGGWATLGPAGLSASFPGDNHAPTVTGPTSLTTAEDTSISLTGSNVISIQDTENDQVSVTLTAGHGTLTVGTQTGLSITLTGLPADVTHELSGMIYTPSLNYYGPDSISGHVVETLTAQGLTADSNVSVTVDHPPTLSLSHGAGLLDTTFSVDGKVTTDLGSSNDNAKSVAIQADGKIVVAGNAGGDFGLARYNTDGTLDTSFSGDGKVITGFGEALGASSVAIQADGKIVVAGYARNGSNYNFALARYNSDGSLDTTFDGDGTLTTKLGDWCGATDMTIQADGKIVVAGYSYNGSDDDFALARYNGDGSLDTSFDGDGKLTTDFGGLGNWVNSVAIQSDGKIVAAGGTYNGRDNDLALARYNGDGSLDTTFDSDGKLNTDFSGSGSNDWVNSVAIQGDGKIVVAANSLGSGSDFVLARYNGDGSLDTTFDSDGKLNTDFAGWDYSKSVTIQSDGKIVVAGDSYKYPNADFALARYNSDGSLDTTFDNDGKLTTAIGSSDDYANSVAIQADGNIVVAGQTGGNFALARYDASHSDYTENASAQVFDSTITLTDIDSDNMSSAKIQITGNYQSSEDTLSIASGYSLPAGVTANWDGSTGELTLNGLANTADYQSILAHVTYTNSSDDPNTNSRTVSWTIQDEGGLDSVPQTGSITVTAVNDAPTASGPVSTTTLNEDGSVLITVHGTDVDNPALSDVSFAITSDVHNGTLVAGDTELDSAGHYSKLYTYTPNAKFNGSDPFEFTFTTKSETSSVHDKTSAVSVPITVTVVNDLPEATGPVATTSLNEDGMVSITVYGTDVDNPALSDVSFAVTSDVHNGTLVAGDMVKDSAGHYSKVYTYTPNANFIGSDNFEFTFTTKSETSSATDTASAVSVPITVNDVNDAPLVSGPSSNIHVPNGQIERIVLTCDDGDLFQNQIVTMILDTPPSNGTLHLSQSDAQAGVNELHTGSVITAISNGGNQTLFFKANTNGSDTFTFHARDNGGGLNDTSGLFSIRLTVNSAGGNNPVQPWIPPNNPPTTNPPGSHENTPHNIPIFGPPNSLMPTDINPVNAPLSTTLNPMSNNVYGPSSVDIGSGNGTGNPSFNAPGMEQHSLQSSPGPAGNSPSQVAAAMMAEGLNVQEQQQSAQKFVQQQQITEQGHAGDQPVIGQQAVFVTPQPGQTNSQNNVGFMENTISGVLQQPRSEQVASLVENNANGGFTYGPNTLFFSNNQSSGNEVHQGAYNQLNPQITVNMSKGSFTNYLNWIARATIS